jgi:hypothetical protein
MHAVYLATATPRLPHDDIYSEALAEDAYCPTLFLGLMRDVANQHHATHPTRDSFGGMLPLPVCVHVCVRESEFSFIMSV